MKRYAIENVNGQWWTGSCWGVVQAREEFEGPIIDQDIDGLEREVYTLDPVDIRYYPSDSSIAVASVRKVSR